MSKIKLERFKNHALALLLACVMALAFISTAVSCETTAETTDTVSLPVFNSVTAETSPYRNLNLTPGGRVNEMRFTWQSQSRTGSIRLYEAGGRTPIQTADSTTHSLDTRVADTIFYPGQGSIYTVHHVTFTGLRADTMYEYVVIGEGFESERKPFRSGTNQSNFSFLIGGDPQIGVGEQIGGAATGYGALFSADLDRAGWFNAMETALAHSPHAAFWLPVGDQVHTRNHNEANPHGWQQSQFMHDIYFSAPHLHNLPMAPVIGNHDGSGVNNVNHQLWHSHYNTPFDAHNIRRHSTTTIAAANDVAETSIGRTIYTQFDYYMIWGNTLFIMLDSNTRSWPAGRLQWFENVIASYPDVDWKVAVFHHAPYSVYRATNHAEKLQTIPNILPELERLGIDVVLTGHCHSYSRSHPMRANMPIRNQRWLDGNGAIRQDSTGMLYNAVLNPDGIVYFAFNSATGSGYYNVNNMAQRDYIAYYNQNFRRNFSVVDVTENTFTVTTYQINGGLFGGGSASPTSLVDVFTIVRGDAQGNVPANINLPQRTIDGGDDLLRINNPEGITLPVNSTLADIVNALPLEVNIETVVFNNERGQFVAVRAVNTSEGYYGRNTRPLMTQVQWNTSEINFVPGVPQTFTIIGNVSLPRGVNPAGRPTTANIEVTLR